MTTARTPVRSFVCALCACAIASCASEERVTQYKPFFAGIDGAEHQTQPVNSRLTGGIAVERTSAVEEDARGNVTLNSPSIRHMMSHVLRTLADEDAANGRKVFAEQVVSESSRAEMTRWGTSAEDQYDLMRAYYNDVYTLMSRLPMGEHTPTALMRKAGTRRILVELQGIARRDVRWKGFIAERTGNEWKLVLPLQ